MNRIKSWVRAFFGFSRSETNAFLVLLPLMFVSVFIMPVYQYFYTRQPKDYTQEIKTLDSLVAILQQKEKQDSIKSSAVHLFPFDPNVSTKEELIDLGFPSYLANRVENYRKKGGKFIVKSDLLKLYGMDSTLYKTLYSWITLPVEKPASHSDDNKETGLYTTKPTESAFNLNLADSIQLTRIYGIGPRLSVRIIKYRKLLGGFIAIDQLKEVYGLDSIVIQELKNKSFIEKDFQPHKIDINTANEKELAAHPYITYSIAKAITAYRFQHGYFKSIDDLTLIAIVDSDSFEKIKPYLSVNP